MVHNLIVIDTETGGFDCNTTCMVEIAMLAVQLHKRPFAHIDDKPLYVNVISTFHRVIWPDRAIGQDAAKINSFAGQHSNWATEATPMARAMWETEEWLRRRAEGSMFCGVNVAFDIGFLKSDLQRHKQALPDNIHYRTLELQGLCFPLFFEGVTEGTGLRHLRKWVGHEGEQEHTALADAMETVDVLQKYIRERVANG